MSKGQKVIGSESNKINKDEILMAMLNKLPIYDFRSKTFLDKWLIVCKYLTIAGGSKGLLKKWFKLTREFDQTSFNTLLLEMNTYKTKVENTIHDKTADLKVKVKSFMKPVNISVIADGGQAELSKYFAFLFKSDVKTLSSTKLVYIWNKTTTLWEEMKLNVFTTRVGKFIADQFDSSIATLDLTNAESNSLSGILKKEKSKYSKIDYARGVATYLMDELNDIEFISNVNKRPDVVNFKNGIYELKTGTFRQRIQSDWYSKCLSFDYEKPKEQIVKKIRGIIKQICNNDKELMRFNLEWFGYCLTGETSLQKWLLVQGHTAENGKSTLFRMFENVFDIYAKCINRQFLEIGYDKKHKIISGLAYPMRMVYMEEMSRNKLDVEFMKGIVDAGKVDNEVLFGTTELLKLQIKLCATTNKDIKFEADAGGKRRLWAEVFKNKFVDSSDFVEGTPGMYLKDPILMTIFETNEDYKRAFTSIILPYATMYYDNGTIIAPKEVIENAKSICNMNDPTRDFIEDYFKVTHEINDRVHKDIMISAFKNYSDMQKVTVNYLNSELKKFGVQYDKNIMADGKRGYFTGIKMIKMPEKQENDNDYIEV